MSRQITFTSYIPTALVGVNSPSKTLAAEAVTGLPIPTGALPGLAFFLSEKWANQLSLSAVNGAPPLQCHAGWYMVVGVDAGATAANISQGSIGAQLSLAGGPSDMTDMSHALNQGINPVIFLNAVTPGNYTIVQIGGDASVQLAASQTTAVGSVLASNSSGLAVVAGSISDTVYSEIIGIAEQVIVSPAAALTLSAAAAASGGSTVYTGTITGGGTNAYAGNQFFITGFDLAANNSPTGAAPFLCTASTTTTLTLSNPIGVADTHAGTATAANLVRATLNFPFGGVK